MRSIGPEAWGMGGHGGKEGEESGRYELLEGVEG
jgi:hypothetical protein